jgi:hypothetical protein
LRSRESVKRSTETGKPFFQTNSFFLKKSDSLIGLSKIGETGFSGFDRFSIHGFDTYDHGQVTRIDVALG